MKTIAELMRNRKMPGSAESKTATEYADLVNEAAKYVKQPYIVMHKRIERAFGERDIQIVMSHLRRWVHMASKDRNPGMCINLELKRYKEAIAPQPTTV